MEDGAGNSIFMMDKDSPGVNLYSRDGKAETGCPGKVPHSNPKS